MAQITWPSQQRQHHAQQILTAKTATIKIFKKKNKHQKKN
jgi:hypothetical protein